MAMTSCSNFLQIIQHFVDALLQCRDGIFNVALVFNHGGSIKVDRLESLDEHFQIEAALADDHIVIVSFGAK